ncbi:dynein light chain roadblock [Anaeramoeba flamelloides]|uniref:Dynein light chain roadblock n=1 Tax=Anaeramoeba flamelloides TaxID=1746091 RepID=A0AAV7ZFC5_9EUKA|nr:dynein light chain roadblock [Anaeramoeba flamelloides]|eukprot:Anaeramoba_flamelloidesa580488_20.p1 GENE.a580488_20~~a580488_20.p1  ORF type:complete len:119 (+),score=35.98 a580488_20:79-435(+)
MTTNTLEIENQNQEGLKEIEDIIKRFKIQPGFIGLVAITKIGQVIRTTFEEPKEAEKYALYLSNFLKQASTVVDFLKEGDEVSFLRMKTKREEILIIPGDKHSLIVVSHPNRRKEVKF